MPSKKYKKQIEEKKIARDYFMEEYVITYSVKKENGLHSHSEITSVFVEVKHGINEKNNHSKARKEFEKKYPHHVITKVEYV